MKEQPQHEILTLHRPKALHDCMYTTKSMSLDFGKLPCTSNPAACLHIINCDLFYSLIRSLQGRAARLMHVGGGAVSSSFSDAKRL